MNDNEVILEWQNKIRPKINEFLDACECKDENTLQEYLKKDRFMLLEDIELFSLRILSLNHSQKKYFCKYFRWMRDTVFKNYYTHHNKIFNLPNSTYEHCKNDYFAIHELSQYNEKVSTFLKYLVVFFLVITFLKYLVVFFSVIAAIFLVTI